jgi:hypothetical protein
MGKKDKKNTVLSDSQPQLESNKIFKTYRPTRKTLTENSLKRGALLGLRKEASLLDEQLSQAAIDSSMFYSQIAEYEYYLSEWSKTQSIRYHVTTPQDS